MMKPFKILFIGYQMHKEDLEDIAQCGIPVEVSYFDTIQLLANMSRSEATIKSLEVVENTCPNLIFCNTGVANLSRWLDLDFYDEVKKRGIKICDVIADSFPSLNSCELMWILKNDYLFIIDRPSNCEKFSKIVRELGLSTRIYHWPVPNHITKYYLELRDVDKQYDVTFLGRLTTSWRISMVTYLTQTLPQFGFSFTHLNPKEDLSNYDYAKSIMQSKISVNCLTSLGTTFQIKGRVIELVASSAMPLIEDNPETRKFIPANCAVYYDGYEDCAYKAAYYLQNVEERQVIASNGAKWYAENFDSRDIWRRLFISCQCDGYLGNC